MDEERKIELSNLYKEIPEQQLLDMLSEDEKGFEQGAYSLLVEEAKRRGLENELYDIARLKKEGKEEKNQIQYKPVKIYTTPKLAEIAVIKSILDAHNIPYYIKGENFGTLYGSADGLTSMDIMVREDYTEEAKELLKDFINPQNREI